VGRQILFLNHINGVPERTTLAGRVAHEVNCVPVDNEESQRMLAIKTLDSMKPKHVTKFVDEDMSEIIPGFIQPGTVAGMNAFGGFIVSITEALAPAQVLTFCRKPTKELLVTDLNSQKLLVCPKMSFLISCSSALLGTNTGR
jgi:hypothetical protein